MGRIIRTVLIAAIAVVLLIVGAYLIAADFSGVAKEYVCEGETRWVVSRAVAVSLFVGS
jgi:hypothetical protein